MFNSATKFIATLAVWLSLAAAAQAQQTTTNLSGSKISGVLPAAHGGTGNSNGTAVPTSGSTVTALTINTLTFGTAQSNATTPGVWSYACGSGTVSALPTGSWGWMAPVCGGTSYVIQGPATMTAGVAHFGTPATVNGVLTSEMTSSPVANADLVNSSMTVGGVTCTLGSSCTPPGGSPANIHTSSSSTGIGGGSAATTPTHTVDIQDTATTQVVERYGATQSSDLHDWEDASGNIQAKITQYGNFDTYQTPAVIAGAFTEGLAGVPVVIGVVGLQTGKTAAYGTSASPIAIASTVDFYSTNTYSRYTLKCNIYVTTAGSGTVTFYPVYTDITGATPAGVAVSMSAVGMTEYNHSLMLYSPAYGSTPVSFYTTYSGTGTYAAACTLEWEG